MIHQRTNGNPLFMVQMLKHLEENGALGEHNGQWVLRGELTAVESSVPKLARDLIEQQFERLSELEQQVLEAASAIGVKFSAAAVAAAAETDVVVVEKLCEGLARRQHLLQLVDTSTQLEGPVLARYAFNHWLCQDVVYQRLGETQYRVQLHQRIGQYLRLKRERNLGWQYNIISQRPRMPSSARQMWKPFVTSPRD